MSIQPPLPDYRLAAAHPLHLAGKNLWLRWILITLVAYLIAFITLIIAYGLMSIGPSTVNRNEVVRISSSIGVLTGGATLIGWLQRRTLLPYLPLNWLWIVATVGGLAVGVATLQVNVDRLIIIIDSDPGYRVARNGMLFFGVIGVALGFAQWLSLRTYTQRAWVWIAAQAVAAIGAGALMGVTIGWWRVVVPMLCYAAITGGALVWLLGRRIAYRD